MFSFLPGTFPEEIICCCPDSSTCSFVTTRVKSLAASYSAIQQYLIDALQTATHEHVIKVLHTLN